MHLQQVQSESRLFSFTKFAMRLKRNCSHVHMNSGADGVKLQTKHLLQLSFKSETLECLILTKIFGGLSL